jgi:hypothetical protein
MLDWERTTVYVSPPAKIIDPKGLANYAPRACENQTLFS